MRFICFLVGHKFGRPPYHAGPAWVRGRMRMYKGNYCYRCNRVIDLGDWPTRAKPTDTPDDGEGTGVR